MAGGFTLGTEKKTEFDQPFVKPTLTPQAATLGTVSAPTETVQGQVSSLMSASNPLLKKAQTKAVQAANQRGLLNSSMATQAGTEAMLSAALPIAQQDAQTYARQALANQEAKNRFGEQANQFSFQSALSGQDYGQRQGLAETEQSYRKALQTQAEAAQTALQSAEQTFKKGESALTRGHQTSLQTQAEAQQKALQTQAEAQRKALQTQAEAARVYQQSQAEKHQTALQKQVDAARTALSAQESTQKIAQLGVESAERRKTIAAELTQRLSNATALENLSSNNKKALAQLNKNMDQKIQGSASASQILTQTMDAIGEVSANKDLSDSSVNKRIGSIVSNANANLKLIESWQKKGSF